MFGWLARGRHLDCKWNLPWLLQDDDLGGFKEPAEDSTQEMILLEIVPLFGLVLFTL